MLVSLIFQQGLPTSLGCFSSVCTISILSWKTIVVSVIMSYTLKIKEVLSYVDVLLSLERETNQKCNLATSTEIE
jgi:hypothetical protein